MSSVCFSRFFVNVNHSLIPQLSSILGYNFKVNLYATRSPSPFEMIVDILYDK